MLLYIFVSLLSFVLGLLLSVIYSKYKIKSLALLYYIFMIYSGSQHYAIIFNNKFYESWFFINFSNVDGSGFFKLIAAVFIFLIIMTMPPSKFAVINVNFFNR